MLIRLSAKESRPPYDYKCDFKFKSYTFNAGVATLGDLNLSIFNHTSNDCFQKDFLAKNAYIITSLCSNKNAF